MQHRWVKYALWMPRFATLVALSIALAAMTSGRALAQARPGLYAVDFTSPVAPDGSVATGLNRATRGLAYVQQLPSGELVFVPLYRSPVETPQDTPQGTRGAKLAGAVTQWTHVERYDPTDPFRRIAGDPPREVVDAINRRGLTLRALIRFARDGESFTGTQQRAGYAWSGQRLETVTVYTEQMTGRRIGTRTAFARTRNGPPITSIGLGQPFLLTIERAAGAPTDVDVQGPMRIGLFRDGDDRLPAQFRDSATEFSAAANPAPDGRYAAGAFDIVFAPIATGAEPRLEIDRARRRITAYWAPGWTLRAARVEGGAIDIRPTPTDGVPTSAGASTGTAGPACTSMGLAPVPLAPKASETFILRLTYQPTGCNPNRLPIEDWYLAPLDGATTHYLRSPTGVVETQDRTFTARRPGPLDVMVRRGELSARTVVDVRPNALCQLTVGVRNGEPPAMMVGGYWELQALERNQPCMWPSANATNGTRWRSSDLSRAKVSSEGLVQALAPGRVTIEVEQNGARASIGLQVLPQRPCENIYLRYGNYSEQAAIVVGGVAGAPETLFAPLVDYASSLKGECARPAGAPTFTSGTPTILQVDARSGLATGLEAGEGLVRVNHGPLTATAQVRVSKTETCSGLKVVVVPVMQVGDALQYRSLYEPPGCTPPPGRSRLTPDPVALFERDAEGRWIADQEGEARLFVVHGRLRGVGSGSSGPGGTPPTISISGQTPCRALQLNLEPLEARVGETVALDVRASPQRCALEGEREVILGDAPSRFAEVLPGGRSLRVRGGPGGDVTVRQGPLSASATLAVTPDPEAPADRVFCEVESATLSRDTIPVGGTAVVDVRVSTRDCVPVELEIIPDTRASLGNPSEFAVERSPDRPNRFLLFGVRGGELVDVLIQTHGSFVDAAGLRRFPGGPRRAGSLTVVGPACQSMTARFTPDVLRVGQTTVMSLDYQPTNCTRPTAPPQLSSDAPAAAMPVALLPYRDRRSAVGLSVVARPGLRRTPATIVARHGELTAKATVYWSGETAEPGQADYR